ncbi:TolC family protein [Labilibacter sediminis]|nr:TolC family protein [Labilibacter sediminis]
MIDKMKFISTKIFLLLYLTSCASITFGQARPDSTVLSYNEYVENILLFHPVAQKANLKDYYAKAELMQARGALDPTILADWDEKNFDDKLYYKKYQAKLKFPTSFGLSFVGGYENTEGNYINPENKTDEYGLWHMGVEMDVLSGLLVNERKTAIRQAKVYQYLARNEQNIILSDLLYNALYAYHTWQMYHYYMQVLTENIAIARVYFDNTRKSFLQGEKTAMDTLETFILYQDAVGVYNKNELYLIKSKNTVENYLWFNEAAVTLQSHVTPESYKSFFNDKKLYYDSVQVYNHPNIQASINKLSLLEIEQRLKREKLKPKLKFKYNALVTTKGNAHMHTLDFDNNKIGFGFSMPLFLRSERADVKKGRLKIREIELDIQNKKNELLNKLEASWENQELLKEQIVLFDQNVDNYKRLLNGENEKYLYGESSVFLLNKRQEKYINSQLKLTESYFNHHIELLTFLYYSNQLIPTPIVPLE